MNRRNVLASLGISSLSFVSAVGASQEENNSDEYAPLCGGSGSSTTLNSDSESIVRDAHDGQYRLESTLHASEYNSWADENYCDFTHRIHFGATGNAFVWDGEDYLERNSVASNELSIDASGNIVSTSQQDHNEAIGGYEAFEEEPSDVDENFVQTAVSGAVSAGTALAFSNPASTIAASMAFTYLTERSADENNHSYELIWDWINNVGDAGEGTTDSCVYARMDVTTRDGNSAEIDASASATDIGSSSAISTTNFTVSAPTCSNAYSLNQQSLSEEGLIRVTDDIITDDQKDILLSEEPKEILDDTGSLLIKRDTTVGRAIQGLNTHQC
ncbi:hypothetical protein [Halostagnicola bangensis]